jgi:PPP family 3-phenylpropionic acid transporter
VIKRRSDHALGASGAASAERREGFGDSAARIRALRGPFLATGVAQGVFVPFMAPLLADRGYSPQEIGLVFAVASAAIVAAAPIWGHVGDVMFGPRRTMQGAVLLAAFAALLLGERMAPLLVGVAVAAQYLLQTAFVSLLDSIAMHTLGPERRRYGRLRLLLSLSYAIAAFAAGFLYDRAGYGEVFLVFPAAAIVLLLLLGAVPDPPRTEPGAQASQSEGRVSVVPTVATLRAKPRFLGALAAILLASVGLLAANVFLPLRLHDLNTPPSLIALSATASALFEIPVMLMGKPLADRLGLRGLFVLGCVMYLAAIGSWIAFDDPVVLVVSRVLTGFGFGSFTVSSVVALGVLLPEELQASAQALRTSAIFAVAVVGYLFGGFVYGLLGSAAFFSIAASGPVVGALLAWRWLPKRHDAAISLLR